MRSQIRHRPSLKVIVDPLDPGRQDLGFIRRLKARGIELDPPKDLLLGAAETYEQGFRGVTSVRSHRVGSQAGGVLRLGSDVGARLTLLRRARYVLRGRGRGRSAMSRLRSCPLPGGSDN